MIQCQISSDPLKFAPSSDAIWINLYTLLPFYVKRLVYSSGISSWRGQEEDIVEDIVQETIIRVLTCIRRADCGESTPIGSLKALSIVIARNYYQDLRRRDKRLLHVKTDEQSSGVDDVLHCYPDPSELAINNMYLGWLFIKLSQDIVKFPDKQRKALLVDIANLMHFDEKPTPLQQAFLNQKIRLQDYQQPLPINSVERTRHASLLSLALKRVSKLNYV